MIDAHCHLDDPRFDVDRDAVLGEALEAGIERLVIAGVSPSRWRTQSDLAHRHAPRLACTYGVHPWTVAAASGDEARAHVHALARALDDATLYPACGLGEIGLDRSRRVPRESLDRQARAFRDQLALARERDLPVVLHVVGAQDRALRVLEADGLPAAGGVAHAYGGSPELVARYVALGLHLSFGGTLTWPGAERRGEAARRVPAHLLLVETDAPDLPPQPLRPGRNTPAALPLVVAALANARGEQPEAIASLTAANARRLFRLEP